jgi:hypothetical protein
MSDTRTAHAGPVCPHCRGQLALEAAEAVCGGCATRYPRRASGGLDLRLRGSHRVGIDVDVGRDHGPPLARRG